MLDTNKYLFSIKSLLFKYIYLMDNDTGAANALIRTCLSLSLRINFIIYEKTNIWFRFLDRYGWC